MEEKKVTLGGFDAILDTVIPNYQKEENIDDPANTEDDDDIESIKKKNVDPVANKVKTTKQESDTKEDDTIDDKVNDKDDKQDTKDDKDDIVDIDEPIDDKVDDESTAITSFFDALASKLGWEEDEDNKPKDVDSLIDYFTKVIEDNSQPDYASEEVQQLDEYVRNGGDLKNYFQVDGDLDLEDIDMEDEANQKAVLKEYLKEKGIASEKINKRITRYEDLGALEDEATDALEELKEIKTAKKEQLLTDQRKAREEAENRQREYYTAVVDEIKGLDNIRGIKVPEKDKNVLMNYIFKPEADGKTKYQKDYAKSLKNLIESAYFTMKGDTLLNAAKQEGSKSATDRFKDSLRNSSVSTKNKNTTQRSGDDNIWSSVSRTLRNVA